MRPKTFLTNLTIIHSVLCGGLMLFGIFAYVKNGSFTARMDQNDVFIYIVPIAAVVSYFLSQLMFKKKTAYVLREEEITTKLEKYLIASLVKYAILEGAGVLALMAYFWKGNALYLVIAIVLIAYLCVQRPTAKKIRKELPLTLEEQRQFNNLT